MNLFNTGWMEAGLASVVEGDQKASFSIATKPRCRGGRYSFPCRYETIEEMKEAVTKVIDTLTQEDFDGALQKLLERYNKCIATGGNYLEGD